MYKKVSSKLPPDPPREQAFDFGPAFEFGNGELFRNDADGKPVGVNSSGSNEKYQSIFTYGNNQKNWSIQQINPPMPYSQAERFANFCITGLFSILVVFLFPILGWFSVKKLEAHERLILMRLGRMRQPVAGPGYACVLPLIDHWQRVDLRPKTVAFAEREFFTADRGIVVFAGEAVYSVREPELAVTAAADPRTALARLTEATVQRYVARLEADELPGRADRMQADIAATLTAEASQWGLQVTSVALGPIQVVSQPPPRRPLPEGIDIGSLTQHLFGQLAASVAANPGAAAAAAAATAGSSTGGGDEESTNATGSSIAASEPHHQQLEQEEVVPELDEYLAKARRAVHVEEIRRQLGAAFQFHLVSDAGQPLAACYVDATTASAAAAERGLHPAPDVTVALRRSDLADLRSGQLPMWQAVASGRIAVQGDLQVAKRLKVLND